MVWLQKAEVPIKDHEGGATAVAWDVWDGEGGWIGYESVGTHNHIIQVHAGSDLHSCGGNFYSWCFMLPYLWSASPYSPRACTPAHVEGKLHLVVLLLLSNGLWSLRFCLVNDSYSHWKPSNLGNVSWDYWGNIYGSWECALQPLYHTMNCM